MTTRRPPGSSQAGACVRKAASSSNSRFTAIRKAWKTRVAGCSLPLRPPGPWACSNNFTNCRVVWKGRRRRSSTTRRAMRRARCSSPYSRKILSNSVSRARFNRVAAVRPGSSGLNRMSSGSSPLKEKPRCESCNCKEDRPRSRRMPATPGSRAASSSSPNWA